MRRSCKRPVKSIRKSSQIKSPGPATAGAKKQRLLTAQDTASSSSSSSVSNEPIKDHKCCKCDEMYAREPKYSEVYCPKCRVCAFCGGDEPQTSLPTGMCPECDRAICGGCCEFWAMGGCCRRCVRRKYIDEFQASDDDSESDEYDDNIEKLTRKGYEFD